MSDDDRLQIAGQFDCKHRFSRNHVKTGDQLRRPGFPATDNTSADPGDQLAGSRQRSSRHGGAIGSIQNQHLVATVRLDTDEPLGPVNPAPARNSSATPQHLAGHRIGRFDRGPDLVGQPLRPESSDMSDRATGRIGDLEPTRSGADHPGQQPHDPGLHSALVLEQVAAPQHVGMPIVTQAVDDGEPVAQHYQQQVSGGPDIVPLERIRHPRLSTGNGQVPDGRQPPSFATAVIDTDHVLPPVVQPEAPAPPRQGPIAVEGDRVGVDTGLPFLIDAPLGHHLTGFPVGHGLDQRLAGGVGPPGGDGVLAGPTGSQFDIGKPSRFQFVPQDPNRLGLLLSRPQQGQGHGGTCGGRRIGVRSQGQQQSFPFDCRGIL